MDNLPDVGPVIYPGPRICLGPGPTELGIYQGIYQETRPGIYSGPEPGIYPGIYLGVVAIFAAKFWRCTSRLRTGVGRT